MGLDDRRLQQKDAPLIAAEAAEIGADVTYAAAEDGKKVAEIAISQIDKDDWGVVEFSACQSFVDKYRSADEPK